MFNWGKRSRDIDDFATTLARDIVSRCPPASAHEGDRISMVMAKAIDDVCARAAAYQREKRLGMFGKAKLGTTFKYQLKDAGYSQEFIDSLTRQLLLKISAV